MTNSTEMLLLGAAIIIVCGVAGTSIYTMQEGKGFLNQASNGLELFQEGDTLATSWEGRVIMGNQIYKAVEEFSGIPITIRTPLQPLGYLFTSRIITNKSPSKLTPAERTYYFVESASYTCTLNYDANMEVASIIFTQEELNE